MPSISVAMTDSLGIATVGFCLLGWGFALLVGVVNRARKRQLKERIQRQLGEMRAQAAHYERQRDEYNSMLVDARHELLEANERYAELLARFDQFRQSLAPGEATSAVNSPEGEHAVRLKRLEDALVDLRRSRDRAEHNAEVLRSANQAQLRKIAAMTMQLDEIALSMQDTQRALTEKQREVNTLQNQVAASNSQVEALSEQLQNADRTRQDVSRLSRKIAEMQQARDELSKQLEEAVTHQGELTRQLEGKTAGYSAAERMLQESTASELQLRRDLRTITLGREQLELQNLELKRMLEQLGRPVVASSRAPVSDDADVLVEASLNAAAAWQTVTESDIGRAVVSVAEIADAKPVVLVPAKSEVTRTERPEPAVIERELREARLRIELLEASMADLEYLREQNAKLSDEWSQDRGAARELTALQMEHKRLRLDLQLATEKLASQSRTLERVAQLEAELQEHRVEQELVTNLRRQLRELDAENFALRNANSGTYPVAGVMHGLESESRELGVAPLDAAVLSDKLGLAIAATGEVPSESLAAVSGLALSNAERVRELLPIGPISTVQWVDKYGMTVTCKLLTMAGDEMAMTTLGAGSPTEEALHQTLKNVLSSIGWTEKGPVDADESDVATG